MLDLGVLAVDRLALDDPPAERLDHRLVAEADAEHRRAGLGEGADRLAEIPASAGVQGPGETTSRSGPRSSSSPTVGPVVADDLDLRPELAQVLDEVVGEGVVVVDHEHPHRLR